MGATTPAYLIRLESGSIHIKYKIIEFALRFLQKILEMDNSRYPKICLKYLKNKATHISSVKYNWFMQLVTLLNEFHLENAILADNIVNSDKINNIMSIIKTRLTINDQTLLQNSRFSDFYNFIYDNMVPTYLTIKTNFKYTKLLFQI